MRVCLHRNLIVGMNSWDDAVPDSARNLSSSNSPASLIAGEFRSTLFLLLPSGQWILFRSSCTDCKVQQRQCQWLSIGRLNGNQVQV